MLTSSYAWRLALRFARVMIFSGPSAPKFMAEAWVESENVGEGGGDGLRLLEPKVRARSERGRPGAMVQAKTVLGAGCTVLCMCLTFAWCT